MAGKMVTDRQKVSDAVHAATRTHTGDVSAGFAAALAAVTGVEPPVDVTELQHQLGLYLDGLKERLVAADEATQSELVEERDPRRRRDAAVEALRAKLVPMRSAVAGVFGEAGTDLLGIDGETSRDPVVLERQARRAVERLRSGEFETPPARLESFQATPEGLAAELEPPLAELVEALEELALDRRRTEKAQAAKQAALEAYDFAVVRVARLLESLYEVAGLVRLAARLRPAVRRSAPAPEVPEEPEGSEPDEASEVTEAPEVTEAEGPAAGPPAAG